MNESWKIYWVKTARGRLFLFGLYIYAWDHILHEVSLCVEWILYSWMFMILWSWYMCEQSKRVNELCRSFVCNNSIKNAWMNREKLIVWLNEAAGGRSLIWVGLNNSWQFLANKLLVWNCVTYTHTRVCSGIMDAVVSVSSCNDRCIPLQ